MRSMGRKSRAVARQLKNGFEQFEARQLLDAAGLAEAEGEGNGQMISTFQLIDTNPNSPTYNQPVGPADFTQQATLWYFGHST